MVVDEARGAIDDLDRARKAIVMLGAVCHDLGKPPTTRVIDGRIRSLGHEEAGVEPADGAARSAERPFDRRLRRPRPGPGDRRASPEAGRLAQVADRCRRRRVPPAGAKVDLELLARRRAGRLPRPRRRLRLLGDGLVPRARPTRSASSTRRPRRCVMGRHLLALGVAPGPRMGEILKRSTSSSSMESSRLKRKGSPQPG